MNDSISSSLTNDHSYPFSALVGQELLKTALLLCVVNPSLGGLLIRGDKGTAKSTAARGLVALLPSIERTTGCAFNCKPEQPHELCKPCCAEGAAREHCPIPFVSLPLGATEDRIIGSLDLEHALKGGRRALQPGLLATAHRGILYIDEVNLLADHLVDFLLDVAAMGINTIQREGMSIAHPSRFTLIGTMNPEEGELRPQLLDRFGMMVEVQAPQDGKARAEVVRRRLAYEQAPGQFAKEWEIEQEKLKTQVLNAQELLPYVQTEGCVIDLVSEICCGFGVRSLRADIVMSKAAATMAALAGRQNVNVDDVKVAARLVLPHRCSRISAGQTEFLQQRLEEIVNACSEADKVAESGSTHGPGADSAKDNSESPTEDTVQATASSVIIKSQGTQSHDSNGNRDRQDDDGPAKGEPAKEHFRVGESTGALKIRLKSNLQSHMYGRRSTNSQSRQGQYLRSVADRNPTNLAIEATVKHSVLRNQGNLNVTQADFHSKIYAGRNRNLVLFVVDASGSMAALKRMEAVKGAVFSLLADAYRLKDMVAVISFAGQSANLVLPPTKNIDEARRKLAELPTGGRTPLTHALQLTRDLLSKHLSKHEALLVVLTDGKSNVPFANSSTAAADTCDPWVESLEQACALSALSIPSIVVDTEVGFVRLKRAAQLADTLKAEYLSLESITSGILTLNIKSRIRQRRNTK